MFLSNPQHHHNLIIWHLKTDIQKISGYADVLILLLNHCMDALDTTRYVMYSEKHTLYRAVPYLVFLADSDEEKGLNIFKHKNFKINRVQKLFKVRARRSSGNPQLTVPLSTHLSFLCMGT